MSGGHVVAVCASSERGVSKAAIGEGTLVAGHGLDGDAHAGPWHRQVSMLGVESIQRGLDRGFGVGPGSYAENITTQGIVLHELPIGTRLRIGEALVEVTQIGKQELEPSSIQAIVGDSAIPREGIFVRVLESGHVRPGNRIELVTSSPGAETVP